jgi:diacylglycerol O-acyltransferase / wax synthase
MERLSAQDLSMVWPEEFGWPQDIGAPAILDGSPQPGGADGRFPIEAVREQISRRLYLLSRFRQLLYMPQWGLGWPLWVDDAAFDIAEHVNVFPHDIADEAQLLAACEQLRRQRLDRSRPLWQMWFLPGLADGRAGLFMKLHHAIADGVAGVAALARCSI